MKLAGQVAVVTGAASGQGRAVSILFAQEGAKVVVADINMDGARETVAMIRKSKGKAFAVKCDVAKEPQVKRMMARAVKRFGKLTILYNNAGTFKQDPDLISTQELDSWRKIIDVNLTGTFLCCKYGAPEIEKAGGGAIVNVASTLGLTGTHGLMTYVSSKHGAIGLTKELATELGPKNIRVNAICPGPIDTPMLEKSGIVGERRAQMAARLPLRRIGTPEDVAKLALFLASSDSSFVSGAHIVIDGGTSARY